MASKGSDMPAGSFLSVGDWLESPNGLFLFEILDNAVLRVRRPSHYGQVVWSSPEPPQPKGNYFVHLQGDADLCVYPGTDLLHPEGVKIRSHSVTAESGDYYATMRNDGNFCIYRRSPGSTPVLVWATGPAPTRTFLTMGEFLGIGDWLSSANGKFHLQLTHDGLVLARGPSPSSREGQPIWTRPFNASPNQKDYFMQVSQGELNFYEGPDPDHVTNRSGLSMFVTINDPTNPRGMGDFFCVLTDSGSFKIHRGLEPLTAGDLMWETGDISDATTVVKIFNNVALSAIDVGLGWNNGDGGPNLFQSDFRRVQFNDYATLGLEFEIANRYILEGATCWLKVFIVGGSSGSSNGNFTFGKNRAVATYYVTGSVRDLSIDGPYIKVPNCGIPDSNTSTTHFRPVVPRIDYTPLAPVYPAPIVPFDPNTPKRNILASHVIPSVGNFLRDDLLHALVGADENQCVFLSGHTVKFRSPTTKKPFSLPEFDDYEWTFDGIDPRVYMGVPLEVTDIKQWALRFPIPEGGI